jgi:hypothetical protein
MSVLQLPPSHSNLPARLEILLWNVVQQLIEQFELKKPGATIIHTWIPADVSCPVVGALETLYITFYVSSKHVHIAYPESLYSQ